MLICVWRVIAVVVIKIYAFNITTNVPFPFLSIPLSSGIVQDHIIVTCLRVVDCCVFPSLLSRCHRHHHRHRRYSLFLRLLSCFLLPWELPLIIKEGKTIWCLISMLPVYYNQNSNLNASFVSNTTVGTQPSYWIIV